MKNFDYEINDEPNIFEYSENNKFKYRYVIGKKCSNPLVCIAMNPSVANKEISDKTVNIIINTSKLLKRDGWIMLNLYPQYSQNTENLPLIWNEVEMHKNIEHIRTVLNDYCIKEIWVAWGECKNKILKKAKNELRNLLSNKKLFTFWKSCNNGNPRHPSRATKIELKNKRYWNFSRE